MPTQITAYKAKDGTLFNTSQEAFNHDQVADLNKIHYDSEGYYRSSRHIINHKQAYLEILLRTC